MADDIDIEEHDVLDNPRLKNIFPDINNIMSAVDYEEEGNNFDYEENFNTCYQKIKVEPIEYNHSKEIFHTHKNVIIFGSKPSTPQPNLARSFYGPHQDSMDMDSEEKPEIRPCSVVLEDWQVFLTDNPCYCSICQILFATVNEYDFHRMNTHSFLVAVSNNKAMKSTSKISNIDYNPIKEDINKIDLLCKHCNEYYPDEIALIKHKYSLIPQTYRIKKEETEDKSLKLNHKVQPYEGLYLICTICSCFFKKEVFYNNHINICHGNPKIDIVKAPFDGKCRHCTKILLLPKTYNCHVRIFHMNLFYMKPEGKKQGKFRCHLCNMAFSSAQSERQHRATEHKRYVKSTQALKPNKNIDKVLTTKLNILKTNKLKSNILKSKILKTNILKSNTLKTNILKSNSLKSNTLKTNILKSKTLKINILKSNVSNANKNVQVQAFIQKSHLFKCNKCQIYFTSSFGAIEHSRHCVLRKGDWKCQTCRHPFKLSERPVHIQQHALNTGGRFKTVVITDEVLPLLLNRCTICNICFDPRTFKLQHASGCRQGKCVECSTCHLLIHKSSISEHLKYHRELNLTVKDFIITNYFPINKPIRQVEPTSSLALNPYKRKLALSHEMLLHCPRCKCNMRRRRKTDGHTTGQCTKQSINRICKICGLLFKRKGLTSHIKYHGKTHKVTDFVLINILNGKEIAPPFPKFPTCSTCHVHFFNKIELKNHDCGTEEHKSCKLCDIKLSSLAFKIHLSFHPYSSTDKPTTAPTLGGANNCIVTKANKPISDLLKKYESLVSIWNILYRCQICDVFLDSYNSVVEHCQDHFCNMENYNVDISYCKKCKLKFIDKSYDRHQRLHLDNDINVKTFTIIDYDYSKLLSDDWFKIFEQISKDQLQLILSKSIYNEIREVRLHLVSDGSLGSIYKCRHCNYSIDAQSVTEHVRSPGELKTPQFEHSCAACGVAFLNKKSAIAHEISHQSSGERFRIISFNEPEDEFINEALIKNTKSNDLKFVRCQYCAKLINKTIYKNHMVQHGQSVDNTNDENSVFHFYVCSKCGVAVSQNTVIKHVCSDERHKRRCPKCLLCIRTTSMARHNMMHDMYPDMSPENIKVTYINHTESKSVADTNALNDDVEYDAATKKIRFYECTYCQACVSSNTNTHNCMSERKHAKCKKCGIKVYAPLLATHNILHKKIQFDSTNVTIVQFVKSPVKEIGKLFRCSICNLHFIKRKSAAGHLAKGDHNGKAVMCEKCNVPFSSISFSRHTKLHDMYKSFEVIDCYDKDGDSTMLCDVSNSSTEAQTSNTSEMARTSSRVSNSIRESIRTNTVTDLMKQSMITPEIVTNESKIYKCSECDVHFLTADSCYDHTNNHTPLDPTEYIACKICDLQFLCEFLGKHMKNHREKLFDIDKLVVDEYYPNGRIETYSARDRLVWKLVSTTTHSDNE